MRRKRALRSSSEWHSILSEEPNPTWKPTSSLSPCRQMLDGVAAEERGSMKLESEGWFLLKIPRGDSWMTLE